jgi:predicted DsbA family dithiol-disulfide isomerase
VTIENQDFPKNQDIYRRTKTYILDKNHQPAIAGTINWENEGVKKTRTIIGRMKRRGPDSMFFPIAGCIAALAALVINGTVAHAGNDSHKTVAIVDGRPFSEQDVDNTIAVGIYQLRKQALDQLIDTYLMEQAARRAHLTIPEYLEKETAVTVSDADARAQYDKFKSQIKVPFDQLKPRLIISLTNQRQQERLSELRAKLRRDAHVELKLEPPRLEVAVGHSPSIGPANAPVTIIEFADFQSPFCKMEEPVLQQVRDRYGDQVRLVFKDFPPLTSKAAVEAAKGARCANEQGKFWQFHDLLYADQSKLADPDLKADARQLGLDSAKFDSCLDSGKYTNAIEEDIDEGLSLGFKNAPTLLINGHPHAGVQSAAGFAETIDPELQGKGHTEAKSH